MSSGPRNIAISFALCMGIIAIYAFFAGQRGEGEFTFDMGARELKVTCAEGNETPPTREHAFAAVQAMSEEIKARSQQLVERKAALTEAASNGVTAAERAKALADLAALEDDPAAILKAILDDIERDFGCVIV